MKFTLAHLIIVLSTIIFTANADRIRPIIYPDSNYTNAYKNNTIREKDVVAVYLNYFTGYIEQFMPSLNIFIKRY